MFNLQKQIIKNYLGLNIISNTPGELKFKVNHLDKIQKEYVAYDQYIIDGIKLLEGVKEVIPEYNKGVVTILYDDKSLSAQKVYKWVNIVLDVLIENLDEIKKNWETNLSGIVSKLQRILVKRLQKL